MPTELVMHRGILGQPTGGQTAQRDRFKRKCRKWTLENFKHLSDYALSEPSLAKELIQQGFGKSETPKESTSEELVMAMGQLARAEATAHRIIAVLKQFPECHDAVVEALNAQGEQDAT